jgi:hypothetical protein
MTHVVDLTPETTAVQLAAVTIHVACHCGDDLVIDLSCAQDDHGVWSVPEDERFILCENCESLLDAGLLIIVKTPT